mmetsp:Transcript_73945/g.239298  ORF Transcript_73945/g.239298 Transcript_73945/m.239298 type:complete len:276 (+) Transcript_73945:43-870(+)
MDRASFANLRVLVVGDAAVGKTALVENIGTGGGASRGPESHDVGMKSEWTCGCALSVVREVVEVEMRPMEVEVELWEGGGTQTYATARPVFYDGFDAVVLVYDVSNMKSYHNLVVWLFELCTSACLPSLRYWDSGGGSGGVPEADLEDGDGAVAQGHAMQRALLGGLCPVLFVAHKCDLRPQQAVTQRAVGSPLLRPQPPERLNLLDRFLGGGDTNPSAHRSLSLAEERLLDQLCDFVQRGRHTEATSKEDAQSFDFVLWRDFIRRAVEARRNST